MKPFSYSLLALVLLLCIDGHHALATTPQVLAEPISAQAPAEPIVQNAENPTESAEAAPDPAQNEAAEAAAEEVEQGMSDAERIAELTDSIESDKEQITSLDSELENPQSEYSVSEREFRDLDAQLDDAKDKLEKAQGDASVPAEVQEDLQSDVERLTTLWTLAKDRFDLAIEDRKTLKEQLHTLKHKLERNEKALRELTEGPEPEEVKSSEESTDSDRTSTSEASDRKREESDKADDEKDEEMSAEGDEDEEEEKDEELIQAENEAEAKEAEAQEAHEETLSIEARLKDLQQLIAQEQKELNLARKKVDLATTAQHDLTAELNRQQDDGADASEINSLKSAIAATNQRFINARSEVTEINERLNDHRAELSSLQSEHIIALSQAERKRQEAKTLEEHLAALKNPYTLRNILQWLLEHGPRLALIFLGMFVFSHAASILANRSVQLVSRGSMRGSKVERENRAKTLVGVFQNAASVGIFITGSLMILEELGANITVLMGGVAVIGLAVAFGAQNLIKDYFYGFVMLLENQYMLNDTIRIGGVTGQVERITLRMTVLRDGNGVVHFIPNGTINSVSNETHGWSRAVCEIGVSQTEDLEYVLDLLKQVSTELQASEKVGSLLLEAPSDPSIESLGGPTITLKLSVKTSPNKHGTVKQEWYKLIKRALTAAAINAPSSDSSTRFRSIEGKKVA